MPECISCGFSDVMRMYPVAHRAVKTKSNLSTPSTKLYTWPRIFGQVSLIPCLKDPAWTFHYPSVLYFTGYLGFDYCCFKLYIFYTLRFWCIFKAVLHFDTPPKLGSTSQISICSKRCEAGTTFVTWPSRRLFQSTDGSGTLVVTISFHGGSSSFCGTRIHDFWS